MKAIEVLAPAGDFEALKAAVNAGADAVYLGGELFGARRSATNFKNSAMREVTAYCHERNVAVYVTVNTLIKDAEWQALTAYIQTLYTADVDAVIVQDIGVFYFLRTHYPDFEVHLSTQMTLHNSYDVQWASEMGASRVVLARELSFAAIEGIRRESALPLEVFVHGALCIAYSGNCLLSSHIGGRSGNRGACAQPCRKKYQLVGAEDGTVYTTPEGVYLMSPRDIKGLSRIEALKSLAPISLKIEGRMKGPDYVYTVVKAYREAVDTGVLREDDLVKVFNRNYSEGYFGEKAYSQLMTLSHPSAYGYEVGGAVACGKGRLTLKLEAPLSKGDEIQYRLREKTVGTRCDEIYSDGRRVDEAPVGQVVEVPFKHVVPKGARFYKTYDKSHIQQATNDSQREVQRFAVQMVFRAARDAVATLTVTDGAWEITATGTVKGETAQRVSLSREKVEKQLSKLGGTPFVLERLDVDIADGLMLPVSELNTLRRQACDALLKKRALWHGHRTAPVSVSDLVEAPSTQQSPVVLLTFESYKRLNAHRRSFENSLFRPIWVLECLSDYEAHFESCVAESIVLGLPKILEADDFKRLDDMMQKATFDVVVAHIGQLQWIKQYPDVKWYASEAVQCFNKTALAFLKAEGAEGVVAAPEWAISTSRGTAGQWVYGHLPLMQSEYCPIGKVIKNAHRCGLCETASFALIDEKGTQYPLVCDSSRCRIKVCTDKPVYALDLMESLYAKGCTLFKFDFMLTSEAASTDRVRQLAEAETWRQFTEAVEPFDKTIHTRSRLMSGVE